jgi:hypothetical protein
MILLAVLQRKDDAYGVTIHEELTRHTTRPVARGAVYMTLDRLEKKGFLKSTLTSRPQSAAAGLRRLIYGYGLVPAAVGTTIGLAAAFARSRLLGSFLFEIAPTDMATYVGAALVIMAVTALACYLPARRSLRVLPMQVLKRG